MIELTKAEKKIMMILWDCKKRFIHDLLYHFPSPKPPYTSVSTIVRVLVKKKMIGYRVYGNTYQYFPLIFKELYRRNQLSRLATEYFGNALKQLLRDLLPGKKGMQLEIEEVLLELKASTHQPIEMTKDHS